MSKRLLFCAGGLLALWVWTASAAQAQVPGIAFKGLCEASGGAFLDENRFVVASDETNVLRVYSLDGTLGEMGTELDMQLFSMADKSDIEAAAPLGTRIFWISSHSQNKEHQDKPKRQRLFATDGPTASSSNVLIVSLRDPIINALSDGILSAQQVKAALNIEGLAASAAGGLLIGLRAPLSGNDALVLPFVNPEELVAPPLTPDAPPVAPVFGKPMHLNLNGSGIRDLARISIEGTAEYYVVVAGPHDQVDGGSFSLWRWSGLDTEDPTPLDIDLDGLRAEVVMQIPGTRKALILSDDGETCSDEDDPLDERSFRALEVNLPN